MRKLFLAAVLIASAMLAGCATAPSMQLTQATPATPVYERAEFGVQRPVEMGVVYAVREVMVSGQSGASGTLGGGLIGAALGSAVGKGTGKLLAQVTGGIAGAVIGNAVQKSANTTQALEITVKLHSGALVAILQPKEPGFLPKKGDSVRVLGERNSARVVPA